MKEHTAGSRLVEGVRRVEVHGGRLAVRVRPGYGLDWEGPPSLVAEREGEALVLRTPHPRRWTGWIGPEEQLSLTLPPAVEALVVRCTGEVDLRDLDLEGDLHVRAGDLRASGCRGRWRIRTGAGDVTLVGQHGDLEVQAGAGEVAVRGGRLRRVRIRTGAGDVFLDAEVEAEAEVTTGAGSVDLRPRNQGAARIQARSGFGNVVLDLAGVRGGRLELQTGAGTIHVPGGIHVGRRGGLGQRVVDSLGPGEGTVEITTGAGNIRVVGYGAADRSGGGEGAGPVPGPSTAPPAGPARPEDTDPSTGPAGAGSPPAGAGSGPGHPAPGHPGPGGAALGFAPGSDAGAAAAGGTPAPAGTPETTGPRGDVPAPAGPSPVPEGGGRGPYRHPRQVLEALARGELTVEEADRWLEVLEGAGRDGESEA